MIVILFEAVALNKGVDGNRWIKYERFLGFIDANEVTVGFLIRARDLDCYESEAE